MVDYYAALGVARTSEDVVIRAAYLALMRRYHPDTNRAPDAAQRAREVSTAYQVLSDKDKRAAYDGRGFDRPESAVFERPKRPPVGPIFFAATMILLSLAVLVVWLKPSGSPSPPGPVIADRSEPAAPLTEASCVWPNATEAISRELVRQAGKLRAVDRGALALIAPQMVVRISPALASRASHEAGKINCSAAVQLVLPVGVTLPDGRQTFDGEIDYSLRSGGRDSAPRAIFSPANEIAVQLASLRRPPPPPADRAVEIADAAPAPIERSPALIQRRPAVIERAAPAAAPRLAARPAALKAIAPRPVAPPAPRPAVVTTVVAVPARKPKIAADQGCRKFGTRWTELLCESKTLGALDQQLGAFDAQSWSRASADKRELLRRSRSQFSANRIQCTTDACLRQLYVGRMRLVADIMSKDGSQSGKKTSN